MGRGCLSPLWPFVPTHHTYHAMPKHSTISWDDKKCLFVVTPAREGEPERYKTSKEAIQARKRLDGETK